MHALAYSHGTMNQTFNAAVGAAHDSATSQQNSASAAPAIPAVQLPHAVARLRATRLAASTKPFVARGGHGERCESCRLMKRHCLCHLRPAVPVRSGFCLIMGDIEALKPSNTGWLIADMVPDTFAFGWARTTVDPGLLAVLQDPQWQPFLVFPGEFVPPERVVHEVMPFLQSSPAESVDFRNVRRPLFVLLDGTWTEARKMFNKSPYLSRMPVLSLDPGHASSYQLRRSRRDDHFCTSEVAAMCLALAGEVRAAQVLNAYLDVFSEHYLRARRNLVPMEASETEEALRMLMTLPATEV